MISLREIAEACDDVAAGRMSELRIRLRSEPRNERVSLVPPENDQRDEPKRAGTK